MGAKDKIFAITKVIKIKLLKRKIPLVVTWPITNRCNFQCQYCERWKRKTKELTTKQVFKIVDELADLGTIRISLSGGEPLTRKDIGKVISYIKGKGISVVLTSNGSLIPEKIGEIKNLDLLKLSIEGREEIHDRIRGKGSFKKVLQAVEIAQKQGIKFVFNSVLTAYNLDQIDFLISLAEKYKTGIRFTALNLAHAGRAKIEPLFPDKKDYQKAIGKLIEAKKRGRPVLNSFAGLKYLESWPKPQPIPCFASRAFAHLSAEGKLYPCVALEGKLPGKNVMELGFSKAFDTLPIPIHLGGEAKVRQEQTSEVLQTQYTSEVKLGKAREDTSEVGERCPGCWCGGTLELNLLFSLKPRAMLNLRKLI